MEQTRKNRDLTKKARATTMSVFTKLHEMREAPIQGLSEKIAKEEMNEMVKLRDKFGAEILSIREVGVPLFCF